MEERDDNPTHSPNGANGVVPTSEDQRPDAVDRAAPLPFVVGIGGSAGGLETFQRFFDHMPPDSGMSFVLIQHLDPHHESLMPELLATHTRMPVLQVRESTQVEPDHVYVIAPNVTLTIVDGVLQVGPSVTTRGFRAPIDAFFRSLANDQNENAACVVMSGTGSDGTLGVEEMKERGGLVIVQTPESASYDGMPRSAIATGLADEILVPERMPERLVEHVRYLRAPGERTLPSRQAQIAALLGPICENVRRYTGHDFSRYKQATLLRRVERRMISLRSASAGDYLEHLRADPDEARALVRELLISVTQFFRDPAAFTALAELSIAAILDGKGADDSVRVWVPGCATGEEAYSIAMLLRERMGNVAPSVQIFATDIDTAALDVARQGRYPEGIADHVTPERLEHFFTNEDGFFRVRKDLRDMCLFSPHNVLHDPPFSRLDLLSCRNLLIYLEPAVQEKLIPLFHYSLNSNGFLFLGSAETPGSHGALFQTLDRAHRVYARREALVRPALELPLSGAAGRGLSVVSRRAISELPAVTGTRVLERALLDDYAPPGAVIRDLGEVVYLCGRTTTYLEPPRGSAPFDIFGMARPFLRQELRTAVFRSAQSKAEIAVRNLDAPVGDLRQRFNLVVRPMYELGADSTLFLVAFQELGPPRSHVEQAEVAPSPQEPLADQLDRELRATREQLRSTIEELETSNEELKSSNEELQSLNEELQTSKEELQSTNEELRTVNSELQKKVEALDAAHTDLQNLFDSTSLASIFLDRELCIRRFTPAAKEVFRLIAGDVGRPLTDVAARITNGDLIAEVGEVLRSLAPKELDVRRAEGDERYIMRILPYRTLASEIDGVVINFVNVTDLKQAQERERQRAEELQKIMDSVPGAIWLAQDSEARRVTGSAYAYELLRTPFGRNLPLGAAVHERPGHFRVLHEGRELGDGELAIQRAARGEAVRDFEEDLVFEDGTRRSLYGNAEPLLDVQGRARGAIAVFVDVSELKNTEQRLRLANESLEAAERHKNDFLALVSHELRNPLAPIQNSLHVIGHAAFGEERARRALDIVRRQTAHLSQIVDDLLDVSRIAHGELRIERAPLDLGETVRQAAEDHRDTLTAAGLELRVTVPEHALYVRGDRTRLLQVVGNLLSNAVKFTPRGGTVTATVEEDETGEQALVNVHDTGLGIEPERLARLFEPFNPGETTARRQKAGLGLGLSLVKGIVEAHGGTVSAVSGGLGAGVHITVRLPLDLKVDETPVTRVERPSRPTARLRILIIDDDPDGADTLRDVLELGGHEVDVAHSGPEGVEKVRASRPDVVLCDVGLPGMDGYDVARTLRADPTLNGILLIAQTGYARDEDVASAKQAGFDAHLAKPSSVEKLEQLLASAAKPPSTR
jgi:two-component system CheB/CheR fusion protein